MNIHYAAQREPWKNFEISVFDYYYDNHDSSRVLGPDK